ncbi:MAG TPA: protein translocase subunit SecD [Acidimicrobiales bacterium]|nr:protein translocase subunit SecD [Acidimicrobiales bacterium]
MKDKRSLWISLMTVVIVSALALAGTLAAGWSPKLGLDLDGGLEVVYQTAHHVDNASLATTVNILNSRVNALGASGAQVASQGSDEITVSIPGAKNVNQILATLGNTAQLFFRPAVCYAYPYTVAKGKTSATGPLPACPASSQLTATNIGVVPNNSAQGYSAPGLNALQQSPVQAYAPYKSTTSLNDKKGDTVLLPGSLGSGLGKLRMLLGPAGVTGTAVHSANAQLVQGQWAVDIALTGPGSKAWDTLAQQQFHAIIAIDLDGQVIDAPITQPTQSTFTSFAGQVEISGGFTETQAKNLATDLTYGALPVKLNRITVQTVSPSLGKASLRAGLIAGLAGLALVMVYTIFYYRLLGIVVVAGLAVTGALLWSIIAAMGQWFGTTINLAGIIGVIVSVGITVDSYIVYFERLKDEARAGHTVRSSVDKGFRSAFRTVLAADAVSFLGAAILYEISIGDVKGFALFLGISTLLDVVVTYFFTRPFVILLGRRRAGLEDTGRMGMARGLGVTQETAP